MFGKRGIPICLKTGVVLTVFSAIACFNVYPQELDRENPQEPRAAEQPSPADIEEMGEAVEGIDEIEELRSMGDQTAGSEFWIMVTAYDRYGNIAAGYEGTAQLSDSTGTINKEEISFSDGIATDSVVITEATEEVTITVEDDEAGLMIESSEFTVSPDEAFEFAIGEVEPGDIPASEEPEEDDELTEEPTDVEADDGEDEEDDVVEEEEDDIVAEEEDDDDEAEEEPATETPFWTR